MWVLALFPVLVADVWRDLVDAWATWRHGPACILCGKRRQLVVAEIPVCVVCVRGRFK